METFSFIVTQSHLIDVLGYAASGATLCAFAQKQMLPMRVSAIAANLFFIGYGAFGLIYPVLILHLVLLPLNIGRLVEQEVRRRKALEHHRLGREAMYSARRRSHHRLPYAAAHSMTGLVRRGGGAP